MNRELIEKYAAGADVPSRSIAGLERADLLAFPVPGTWSIQQIILHLMDSDLIGSDRMKRVAAEEEPTLVGYNETAFANRLGYEHLSVRDAVEIFRLNRLMTAEILRRLPPSAFQRTGQHTEHGKVTLEQLLTTYVEHVDHHLKFIREKRKLLGKPL
jgi:uncharacterized damage-inducible protein DinB